MLQDSTENVFPASADENLRHNVNVQDEIEIIESKLSKSMTMTPGVKQTINRQMMTPKYQKPPNSASASPASIMKFGHSAPSTPLSPSGSITSACSSVRESAKLAKILSTAERVRKVNILKEKWIKDKEQKAISNKEKREKELKKLQQDSEFAALQRKKQLQQKKKIEIQEKEREKKMLSESLQVRCQLEKDLAEQAKAKRRISIFLNTAIRKKVQEKEVQLELQKKQELVEELTNRRTDFLQYRQNKVIEDSNRRESLANRGNVAQLHREVTKKMNQQLIEEETSLLETRHQNWEDEKKAKQKAEQQRRESIAGRLDQWREQKEDVKTNLNDTKQKTMEDFQLKLQDHEDVQNFKEKLAKRDRKSLADRLMKWREEKMDSTREASQKATADAIERELVEQAYQDEVGYKALLTQQRRESLAYRLDKARKDKSFEIGQQLCMNEVMSEERRIQAADREDVHNYRQQLQDQRRQSLQYRNQTEHQERLRLKGEQANQKEIEVANYQLNVDAWRDVKTYQQKQREVSRRSIANRLAETHKQKETDIKIHRQNLNMMHNDFELKRLDYEQLKTYRDEEKAKSRRSISMHLASWREQAIQQEKDKAKKDLERDEEAYLLEQDREALHAAKLANEFIERQNLLTSSMIL